LIISQQKICQRQIFLSAAVKTSSFFIIKKLALTTVYPLKRVFTDDILIFNFFYL